MLIAIFDIISYISQSNVCMKVVDNQTNVLVEKEKYKEIIG